MGGTASASTSNAASVAGLQGKYLTFLLHDENYGIEILKVREIIGMMDITELPKTPIYVKGVINLRGKVIPVIDLRLKFGMQEKEYDEKTCTIVVESKDADGKLQVGVIVDSVNEVLNVGEDDLESTPQFGVNADTDFILGMAKSEGKVRTLLDIEKVIAHDDFERIAKSTTT